MTLANFNIGVDQPPTQELHVPMSEVEYLDLHLECRTEWANGEAVIMAPDNFEHVDLVSWLGCLLREYADARDLGKVLINNFETHLSVGARRAPDLLFISKDHLHRITPNRLEGASDLAIEVVSPDSVSRDYREKFKEYQQSGVPEYWIFDPLAKRAEAFGLHGQEYRKLPIEKDRINSLALPGFFLKPSWHWQTPRPRVLSLLKELGIV